AVSTSDWDEGELFLPFEMGGVAVHQAGAESAWVHARVRGAESGMVADVTLADGAGVVLAGVTELRVRHTQREALGGAQAEAGAEAFYQLAWHEAPLADPVGALPEGSWVVVATAGSVAATALAARRVDTVVTEPTDLETALAGMAKVADVVCLWE